MARHLHSERWERMFDSMERRYELEILRRSLAMLQTGANAMRREQAIGLVEELAEVRESFDRLLQGLREVIEEGEQALTRRRTWDPPGVGPS